MQEGNYNVNIRQPAVAPNNEEDKLYFGNKGSFICITISYLLAFICEQFTIAGLAVVCSSLLGYSALLFYIDQPRPN